jgi:uncharacterized protein YfaT (DUF1175 family)
MVVMFALIKKRRVLCALLGWFAIVLLVSYFSMGRTVKNSLNPSSPNNHPNALRNADRPALRKLPASISSDLDADGIPDAAELSSYLDRENFRRWFTAIAEMQFYHLSDQWNVDQRDCAGLARFAWREALRRHDRPWFQRMGPGYETIAGDITSYTLDQSPLNEKLFRTEFGPYKQSDLSDGTFSDFADARTLRTFNTRFLSRDRQQPAVGR